MSETDSYDEDEDTVARSEPEAAEGETESTKPSILSDDVLPGDPDEIAAVLAGDEAPVRRRRREPPPIPEILGVAPEQVMKALAAVWKEATDRETPSFRQTLEEGVVRVDCDAASGYLAITTEVDTHRAIGVRRDMVSPLVAALTARTLRDTEERLAAGPAKIPAAQR